MGEYTGADRAAQRKMVVSACPQRGRMHHACAAQWYGPRPNANCPVCNHLHALPAGLVLPAVKPAAIRIGDVYPSTDAAMAEWYRMAEEDLHRASDVWAATLDGMLRHAVATDDGAAIRRLATIDSLFAQGGLDPDSERLIAAIENGAFNAAQELFDATIYSMGEILDVVNDAPQSAALDDMVLTVADYSELDSVLANFDDIQSEPARLAVAQNLVISYDRDELREAVAAAELERWPAAVPL